ncbi:damage-inducible protein, partial [Achromatium sp. WMS2]
QLRVIIGNPPYSAGQRSANDNNANVEYPHLDARITETYADQSTAGLNKSLYDSYIRAIRWASDRIGTSGVIGFVTGSGHIEKSTMNGVRKCLITEFSSIYVVNLRGDIRKNMLSKGRAQEGQNIFGSGSMTGIAISILVKNPQASQQGQIYLHDIGDDLTRDEKLARLVGFTSFTSINWQAIQPDTHGDWLAQRAPDFAQHIALGTKKTSDPQVIFANYSRGIATNRDAWCYNFSRQAVAANMQRMIAFYNSEVNRCAAALAGVPKDQRAAKVEEFIDTDATKISWTVNLKHDLIKGKSFGFQGSNLVPSLYRPFVKQWLYFNRDFNERVLQIPQIFPTATSNNRVICVTGVGGRSGFSALMADVIPCLDSIEKGQCFPLYLYDTKGPAPTSTEDLFNAANPSTSNRSYAITNAGLNHFIHHYQDSSISHEEVFYYIYGILHSPEYRSRYGDNLSKELPRIPRVETQRIARI